jgi:hypothetical protein
MNICNATGIKKLRKATIVPGLRGNDCDGEKYMGEGLQRLRLL